MEKLRIYQKALELVKSVYQLIQDNQSLRNDYSLSDQLKRAAVSVLANIAEGYRRSGKQFCNYLEISSGSTNEMQALLDVVHVVYQIESSYLKNEYLVVGKQIIAFSKTLKN